MAGLASGSATLITAGTTMYEALPPSTARSVAPPADNPSRSAAPIPKAAPMSGM